MASTSFWGLITLLNTVAGVLVGPLIYTFYVTGYCMKGPEVVSSITCGIFSDGAVCGYLHTVVLPPLLLAVGGLHAVTSTVLVLKRTAYTRLTAALGYSYLAVVLVALTQLLLLLLLGD